MLTGTCALLSMSGACMDHLPSLSVIVTSEYIVSTGTPLRDTVPICTVKECSPSRAESSMMVMLVHSLLEVAVPPGNSSWGGFGAKKSLPSTVRAKL